MTSHNESSHTDSGHTDSSRNEFWERVNAALDARRDPLEDARVQQLLEREPDLLDELAALQLTLSATRDVTHSASLAHAPARRRTSAFVGWAALAAGFAAIVVAARWNAPEPRDANATHPAPLALAPLFAPIPPGVLLELRATFTRTSPSGVRIEHVDLVESRSSVERRELGPQGQATLFAFAHHQPRVRQP